MKIDKELLIRLREGKCTEQELLALTAYFQTNLSEVKQLLAEDWERFTPDRIDPELSIAAAAAQQRVWGEMVKQMHQAEKPAPSKFRRLWYYAAASVAVLMIFGMGWLFSKQSGNDSSVQISQKNPVHWFTQENTGSSALQVKLTDGSVVLLYPGGKLSYPNDFGGIDRQVRIKGDAFFEVKRDTLHPFIVNSPHVQIRVLGTSFHVTESKDKNSTEVAVRTGKVMVESVASNKQMYLTANEKGIVSGEKETALVKTLIDQPRMINSSPSINDMNFRDTPLPEVLDRLKRAYGIQMIDGKGSLKNCLLTARLTNQPLLVKLDMICTSIGASYHLEDAKIIIDGPGCEDTQ